MFSIGIDYLTGYATATDTVSRERAEWPPHPARVFMALVAAHHSDKFDWHERAALEWLEVQPPPVFKVPKADARYVVLHYVPVNDKPFAPTALNRQPRTFPKVRPHSPEVFLIWPEAEPSAEQRAALAALCARVTRIGHSSSLVRMWCVGEGSVPAPDLFPTSGAGEYNLRITAAGTVRYLEEAFNEDDIEAYFDLKSRIGSAKGKAKKELQEQFKERFGDGKLPPNRAYPTLALTCSYTRVKPETSEQIAVLSPFDPSLLVLSKLDGPTLGLEATAQLTQALRGTVIKTCAPKGDAPEWLCGHSPDGKRSESPHLAFLPLAFAGHEHADGHLLGLALAFPSAVTPRERAKWLRPLLFDTNGAPTIISLKLGALGVWTLAREERDLAPFALRPDTWCRTATEWASVTPVVLGRHVKAPPTDPQARFEEITSSIAESCEIAGFPRPDWIDIDKNAFFLGVPRSKPDKSGFPLLSPDRMQIHVRIRFAQPVTGPVLIGAGRYRGYGFLKAINK